MIDCVARRFISLKYLKAKRVRLVVDSRAEPMRHPRPSASRESRRGRRIISQFLVFSPVFCYHRANYSMRGIADEADRRLLFSPVSTRARLLTSDYVKSLSRVRPRRVTLSLLPLPLLASHLNASAKHTQHVHPHLLHASATMLQKYSIIQHMTRCSLLTVSRRETLHYICFHLFNKR